MTTIRVKENEPFDVALRRFKRTIEKIGLLTELRAREFYEKPTSERKRKKAAAVKRHYKRVRSMQLPKKLYCRAAALSRRARRRPRRGLVRLSSEPEVSLKERITEDMKAAMRAKDAERLSTIRMLLAACKQREVDERIVLDDTMVIGLVDKLIKQRKDSITAFEQGGRTDLAAKEAAEIKVLEVYLPQRLRADEVTAAVSAIVASLGAAGPGDMGKVMAAAKAQLGGKADMASVSAAVKQALSK